MSRLRTIVLSNFAGAGWSALMSLAFIPVYIRLMGIESYGLVGFYVILIGLMQVLDLGLTPTMNRELARFSVRPESAGEARDFVRTLEMGYWLVGLAIGVVVVMASPLIATRWIHAGALQTGVVKHAVASMGILLALQWPISLYQGGLLGLQRQVVLNGIAIGAGTLRGAGAAMVLWLVSPTVTAFFTWQIIVTAVHAAAMAAALWRSLPNAGRPSRVDLAVFGRIRAFAGGMTGIAALSLVLSQMDKVLLTKMLSLEAFGYYTLAGILGAAVTTVAVQVFNGVFPRFATQVASANETDLARVYHQSSQLLGVLIFPLAAVLSLFASDLLLVWTRNPIAAATAGPVGAVLLWGTAFRGFLHLPHALQLAHGWTSLCLLRSLVSVVLIVPILILMIRHFGAMGAALSWLALNFITFLVEVPIMHRRLLRGEMWRWYGRDLGLPFLAAGLVGGVGRWLIPHDSTSPVVAACIGCVLVTAIGCAAMTSPWLRSQIRPGAWVGFAAGQS